MTAAENRDKNQPWIRPLPERLINKIAAGEVVERPASVVKELVENSLDSGADRIEILIEKSGGKLIKIVDNGCGIGEDQIEIAFSRHATSKIAEFNDLDRILSYGFRGEALPSIASVSRMRMVSRTAESDSGTEIIFEGGVLQSKKPVAAPKGTTIEVGDLFFNTPARRKFLKAETTEARHISRTAMALAMGRYEVGFTYQLNGRKVFSQPPGLGLGERVQALLAPGKKFIAVSGEVGPVALEGFIGLPDQVQSNRNGQYIFINGRFIYSPMIAHAFALGYGELLPRGNFPIGALLLTVDPAEIDVNVHPAKTEVRLTRDREIHSTVHRLIKETLRQDGIIPSMPMGTSPSGHAPQAPFARQDYSNRIPGIGQRAAGNTEFLGEMYRNVQPPMPGASADTAPPDVVRVDTSTGEIISETDIPTAATPQAVDAPSSTEALRYVGRFSDLYLLFQSGEELFVVDQHTAHERILFEETLQKMDDQGAVAQNLLLPVQVDLNAEQMSLFDEAQELLNKSGFAIELFGDTTVRIEAIPAVLRKKSPEKTILAVIDDIGSLKKTGYDLKKAIAQSVACRSAVMSGDRLTDQEALGLVERLTKCENMYSCPHGRPTFVKISRADIDRQFGRG